MGKYTKQELLKLIKNRLIISCQAAPGEPFYGPDLVARFAVAAANNGACAIRANTTADVKEIQRQVSVPVIALIKKECQASDCYITPTMDEVDELVRETRADIIAVDATKRPHPNGLLGSDFVGQIKKKYPDLVLMADISTVEEGLLAQEAKADLVSTTLSGYTDYSPRLEGPDFELIEALSKRLSIPLVAEGRIWTREELRKAFDLGAYSAVIGSAVTRPHEITKRFVSAISI